MDIHIIFLDDEQVVIMALAEGDGVIGDLKKTVKPGESAFGLSFDQLHENGLGPMKVPPATDAVD